MQSVAFAGIVPYDPNDTVFKRREMAIGFTHSKYMLLADPELDDVIKPASQFMHDWMHGFVSSGIFQLVLLLLLRAKALAADGVTDVYTFLHGWVSGFHWPSCPVKVNPRRLATLFEAAKFKRDKSSGHFRCSASDALSLYPLVCWIAATFWIPFGRCVRECVAFIAVCDVIDALHYNHMSSVTADLLRARVDKFTDAYVAAFGVEYVIPKVHWCLHYALEKQRFGLLLSCFVHERKHRVVKRYANHILNTIVFERSVLSEMISDHCAKLDMPGLFHMGIGCRAN